MFFFLLDNLIFRAFRVPFCLLGSSGVTGAPTGPFQCLRRRKESPKAGLPGASRWWESPPLPKGQNVLLGQTLNVAGSLLPLVPTHPVSWWGRGVSGLQGQRDFPTRLPAVASPAVSPGCPGCLCGSRSCPLPDDFQSGSWSLTLVYIALFAWWCS